MAVALIRINNIFANSNYLCNNLMMDRSKKDKQHLSAYIELLQAKGQYWFLGKETQKKLELSTGAIKVALWRLGQKRAICRVKGDFYVIVPPEHRLAGCLPAQWFIEPLMEYLGLPYHIALLSAASIQGAAHQQIMILQVMTTKPLRKITAGNQQIQFYYKPSIDGSWLDTKKTPISYFKLSKPELTAFDLVRYARSFEQLQQAATVLYELAANLDQKLLVRLVKDQKVTTPSAQRLGYLLENVINIDLELNDLESAISEQKPRYISLVSGKTRAEYEKNQRWHVLLNEKIELDDL